MILQSHGRQVPDLQIAPVYFQAFFHNKKASFICQGKRGFLLFYQGVPDKQHSDSCAFPGISAHRMSGQISFSLLY